MHGAYGLTSLTPFLPPEPQWFPAGLSPVQQDSTPYALQHNFLKNETIAFFFSEEKLYKTYVEGGEIIKSCNRVKIWSLLIWCDSEVSLWDWSQGLQLFCLPLVVKEHRTWPVIYWEILSWSWFCLLFLEINWLLCSEQVWKSEVYRLRTRNHKRFI